MMAYEFSPEAEAEFRAAADWYGMQRPGLGGELRETVQDAILRVRKAPRAFAVVNSEKGIRRCRVSRFPYNIFYMELNEVIWIVALAHHRRRPGYWANRIPE